MKRYAVFGDKLIRRSKLTISADDLGIIRGYGVFDFTVAYYNKIHKLDEHLKRFFHSAKILGLKPPYPLDKIKDLTIKLVLENSFKYSSLRFILTGGISRDGKKVEAETFYILNDKATRFPKHYYLRGVRAITADHQREFPEAKSTNYQFAYLNYPTMSRLKAFELFYTPNNIVLEGLTSNLFIVKNDVVFTPSQNVLPGVTRAEVIEICQDNKIKIVQKIISKKELFSADEVFITATLKRVMPIVKIDNKTIGDGKPGAITKRLMKYYDSEIKLYYCQTPR